MMTASLIQDLTRQGVRFHIKGEAVTLDAPAGLLTPEIKTTLTAHKQELIRILNANEPSLTHGDIQERYNERAAILEVEAGHSRDEAERRARLEVLPEYLESVAPGLWQAWFAMTAESETVH